MRSIRAIALVGSVAALLAACSSGGGSTNTTLPTGLPTGLPSLPTALPSNLPTALPSNLPTGLPTGLPTNLPTGIPTGLPGGSLSTGTAHLVFSGSQSKTLDLPFKNGAYAPGTVIGLAFQDDSHDTFAIGGVAFTGTAKTSSVLNLSAAVISPPILVTSSSGECTLSLSDATSTHVKGTADCTNLNGGVNLKATFEASASAG
jgi:hypothetical protein